MEARGKKRVLLGVMVGCLALAGVITYTTRSGGRVPGYLARDMTWVLCRNPSCEAAYQITKKEYFEYVEKNYDYQSPSAPALICQKCGERSVYRAVRCEKCGLVFETGSLPGDYNDRCPKCGYSKLESQKKTGASDLGGR
jgi:ribosomal protein L40E